MVAGHPLVVVVAEDSRAVGASVDGNVFRGVAASGIRTRFSLCSTARAAQTGRIAEYVEFDEGTLLQGDRGDFRPHQAREYERHAVERNRQLSVAVGGSELGRR